MASYTRLGSFLLADKLATVPSGKVYRALSTVGSAFERHYLLCTFSDELQMAGLATRWPEAQRVASQLAGIRGFGANCRLEAGKPGSLSCDYVPGRTLAQVLEKARDEQIPIGVDHALTVLQSMAQAITLMHEKNVHHGTLSPHSVWVGYEGATQILDAPVAAIIDALLPKAPTLKAALTPYRPDTQAAPLQQDLYALGAILYEMLTMEKLPAAAAIPGALAQATLKAAQEEGSIPEEILYCMKRLLLIGQPFATAAEFNSALERVLYDGEYSPTTFNMAFLMHTLFREENEADNLAIKTDQGANFAQYLPPGASVQGPQKPVKGSGVYYVLAGGMAVAVALFAGMFYYIRQGNQQHLMEQQSLQAKLTAFEKEKEANDAKLAAIAKQEQAQKTLEDMFGKQAEEANTEAARATAKEELEAARLKTRDLARQRAEALAEKQALAKGNNAQAWSKAAAAQSAAAFNTLATTPKPQPAPAAPVATPAPAAASPNSAAADLAPIVVQKGNPQAPRGGKDTLPANLQQSEIKVSLKVFVDAAGRPLKVVILKGVEGNSGYNDAAQNAALASTFAPGSKNGKASSGWLDMEFNFGRPK